MLKWNYLKLWLETDWVPKENPEKDHKEKDRLKRTQMKTKDEMNEINES